MSDNIVHISDSSFEADVLQAEGPVLVDFWAEWCGPCKMIAPVLEELAGEYDGKLKICKMDVDANVETAPKYGVRGIPTLIVFNNGDVAGTKVGSRTDSIPKRAIKTRGILRRVGEYARMDEAACFQCFPDSADAAIHHVGRRYDISAGFGM